MAYRFDADGLENGLKDFFENKVEKAVRMYAETAAKKLGGHAKKTAPWTDRTGAARNRLEGTTQPMPTAIRILLAHGVDYGLWLELAMEKKYAVIQPTIDLKSGEIFAGLDRLFDRIR